MGHELLDNLQRILSEKEEGGRISLELDLKLIKSFFSSTDYARGMDYYRQGRVLNMSSKKGERPLVKCRVQGSKVYSVCFQEVEYGHFRIGCSCPRFRDTGRCKHVAAAMIAYVEAPPQTTEAHSDRYAQAVLQSYLHKNQEQPAPPGVPARLVPRLEVSYRDYPAFSFRVGQDKLYVVKDIREFLTNVDQRRTVSYGKGLTLNHGIEQFDARSQAMIELLMNEFSQFRSMGYSYHSHYDPYKEKNQITLTGDSFDRWFDLLESEPLESRWGTNIQLRREDPQVSVRVEKQQSSVLLEINTPCTNRFFGNRRNLYALGTESLFRCSAAFRDKVYPLLAQGQQSMRLALKDLPTFCGCVLPEIGELVEIEDDQNLLQEYLPEECVTSFYFDMEGETLFLKIVFRYGDYSFAPTDRPAEKDGVRRDVKAESTAIALAQRYFQRQGGNFTIVGEEKAYDFLTDSLNSFRPYGEIYLSDRLQSRRIQPTAANVGLSVSDGLLTLTLDTGGFPKEELSALYQSLLLRRKYHRLADGRYLELNGSPCEKVAEIAQMLQLSKQELAKGTVSFPTYRGLYLDGMLSGNEGIQVSRDSHFREMIRSFKTLSESDYALPEGLKNVLRPYQKTGFQWLKTLESYGFGGILADEMGLGKTLQVIAFLATVPEKATGHPNLVVCPASLIYNWGEELTKFAPQLSYRLILGTAAERKVLREGGDGDVWITSYELLRQDIGDYEQQEFYCCVLDEAQHIKNAATLTSKAVKKIQSRQRFVLTGTPVENRLSELWNLFDFLMSGYLYTNTAFREKLEKPIVKSKNPEASAQLRRLVQPFLLRRRKADVLKELPPKEEYVRRISLSEEEQKTYYACVQATVEKLGDEQGKLQILAALTRLRQICCDPNLCFENYEGTTSKLDACMELCQAMVENGHQILLFSQFTSMLDNIRVHLEAAHITCFTLQGSTSKEKRAKLVKAFNAGEASVFLISLKAGGTGLNLTAADIVIHFDPWWNQAAQDQATDRAHRIGQQAHVQVYKLIAKDTIEEKILELQEKKAALMDTISGVEETGGILNMSREDLMSLLDTRASVNQP